MDQKICTCTYLWKTLSCRFCRKMNMNSLFCGLLCRAAFPLLFTTFLLFATATTAETADTQPNNPLSGEMEEIDRAAQEAAEALLMPRGTEEPEEGAEAVAPYKYEPRELNITQAPPDTGRISQPIVQSESQDTGTSNPLDILRSTRRVQFREISPGVYQEMPNAGAAAASPVPEQPDFSSVARSTPRFGVQTPVDEKKETPEEKKPGFMRRVLGKVPIIGPHLTHTSKETRETDKKKDEQDSKLEEQNPKAPPGDVEPAPVQQGTYTAPPPPPPPVLYPPAGEGLSVRTENGVTSDPQHLPSQERPFSPPPTPVGRIFTPPPNTIGAGTMLFKPGSAPLSASPTAMSSPAPQIGKVIVEPPRAAIAPAITQPAIVQATHTEASESSNFPEPAIKSAAVETTTVLSQPMLASAVRSTPVTSFPPAPVSTPETSPTLEVNDLGMPNPAVEENDVIRNEFVAAVNAARDGQFADAASRFREYAAAHPTSRLTPRALFLSIVMEPDSMKSSEARATLQQKFPTSGYIAELKRREATAGPVNSPQEIAELEKQLAADPMGPDSLETRRKLGHAYVYAQNYDRALEVLEPALETAGGTPQEAEILDLTAETLIAKGDNARATRLLDEIISRYSTYKGMARVRLNMGLANEALGYYQRAMAEYRMIEEQSPATREAQAAQGRIADLQKLYYQ
jgi:TolA-binding protein